MGEGTAGTASPTSQRTLCERIQARLDGRVRPLLQTHGGDLEVVSSSPDSVVVRFRGACSGCPLRPVTLSALVEPVIREVAGSATVYAGARVSAAAARRLAMLAASTGWMTNQTYGADGADSEQVQFGKGKESE